MRRRIGLLLPAVLAACGCRAAGVGGLSSRPDPVPAPSLTAWAELIERHNRNAEKIQSLTASPRIQSTSELLSGKVKGRLALERPRNFSLVMRHSALGDVADIGSNDGGFWFWTKNKQEKAIYVCSYEDLATSSFSSTFQPDWIMEALGLRRFSREEAATASFKSMRETGEVLMTHHRQGPGGVANIKETLFDRNGRIREHRFLTGNKSTLLARATVTESRPVALGEPGSESEDSVVLPYSFRLEWIPEKLTLDVTMDGLKVNPEFTEDRRSSIFVEPNLPYPRVNLAELTTTSPTGSVTRSTRPAPPSGNSGVNLSPPEPVRRGAEPRSREGASRAIHSEAFIGAAVPRPLGRN